ncbi:MAG: alkaline phosphatase family protein [Treponema sp.]|nr:alkaline phosphatase family protein [Treponema sp.]
MGILVISFDAIGDNAFEAISQDKKNYPNVAKFKEEAFYCGGVKTVFMSNTYPVHTSISTGKLPKDHGIISNMLSSDKNGAQPWAQMAKYIKTKTIWDAAKEKNLTTAAIHWPVTNGAKIDYHLPETHTEKWQNPLLRRFVYGSFFFQLAALFKYGGILVKAIIKNKFRGIGQPAVDNFITAVTCDLLRRKKLDLVLVHLLAYDHTFHYSVPNGKKRDIAKKAMDTNLGRLLKSWGDDTVIVFSDHSQFDIKENINLKVLYGDSVFEQCGGSAFLIKKTEGFGVLPLEEQPWFERCLTEEEMTESGYAQAAALRRLQIIGIAAKAGYCFSEYGKYKGNHGYPADYDNYNVFYAVRSKSLLPEIEKMQFKNHITDITKIIVKELNLDMAV